MSNLWEAYLSGAYIPDTEDEDYTLWGVPPAVDCHFSASFSEIEEESEVVEEAEAGRESPGALAPAKPRWSLFRRPMPLNPSISVINPSFEPENSDFDDGSLFCEENWDEVVRYCGPEAPVRKFTHSPAMLAFMNGLLYFPEYWRSIGESPSADKRRT
ncbi:uncharacterized protein LOC131016772 [Salvia miltiorrhiza]|uniref:uncharacterized protein LOC131016772 n=1 Tax=Salvia miltiorrhiza TaxID=226208 RepID=UPI0025AD4BE7|nr:uncharacterized protein LOC131016772 [Salvia miltiorrhiza]